MASLFKQLQDAAKSGDLEIVRQCFANGVDQNEHPGMPKESSPLMKAAHAGHTEVVRELLRHSPNIDFSDGDGFTAVTLAGHQKHWDILLLLAEHGADFTIMNASGMRGIDFLTPSRCRSKTMREKILAEVSDHNSRSQNSD